MTKEPAYIRTLREYARDESGVDFLSVEREMHGASERASAIVYGSFVEDALRALTLSKMRRKLNSVDRKQLFGFEGPLGTFSAKITLAYALQLIGPVTRKDLDLVRTLRNHFAHSQRPLSFSMPVVAAVCAELKTPDMPGVERPLGPLDLAIDPKPEARHRYITTCFSLMWRMNALASGRAPLVTLPVDWDHFP